MDGPPPPRVPTLADVAARAGVSTATVSRCLNAPDRVQKDTRDRILEAVKHLGYSPNFGARALAAKRTDTIGAIIPTMDNSIFARGLQAFQTALVDHGMTLLLASSSYRRDLEETQIRTLVARGADGLLLIGHDRDPALYDFLARHTVPVLVSWVFDPTQPRPSVGFDNRQAMAEMTHRVLAQGHRRLATISGYTSDNDRTRDRVAGVRDAMAEVPDCAPLNVVETRYGIETGARAFAQILAKTPETTAVICGNDLLALGAMRQARTMGLRVPQDISITGFDDMEIAVIADPPLTTVRVPHGDMGRQAASMLTEMVRSGTTPDTVALPCEIMERGSLGPAPRS
ncbi:LacI family transcriptional regulator [Jannaschia pagri]|uniref:LacI family transcriptional regulator n=1 Tax=Jannaschia pagri TaxID=2829797 RepID=A0ABQ4NJQ0_9RHOB|nr:MULTISPECIES: LacI family DNA-binding transcriptional regulator [unclassified Jannaschia]GIT90592.1 LacI family transcriptional regulator [Jannaschia sp. AI_61]GIT94424.1 LacI family transcriptional regulator [Jannaschia sp. AI_62]